MIPDKSVPYASAVTAVLRGEQSEEAACAGLGIDSDEFRAHEQTYLASKLPAARESLAHPSLIGTARVVRDRWGVAHCYGETLYDLYFAVGVAQAQDRLWQLDYRRRFVLGRLAEVLGRKALPTDLEHRTIGFERIAASELSKLPDEVNTVLQAYAEGVNAWIEHLGDNLPVEFDLLRYSPEPWTPLHSLAILRHFWWTLTGRLQQIVAAERLQRAVSEQIAGRFLTPETLTYIVPGDTDSPDMQRDGTIDHRDASAGTDDGSLGSNNWVVGPGRSASGKPLLAADPHWPLAFPSMWYEQHVKGAGFDCIGAAYPGVPPVIFGRTPLIAWGRTNNVSSTRDLYEEKVHPEDPERFWDGSGWKPFTVMDETMKVRDDADVSLRIRISDHGPVLNDHHPAAPRGFIPAVEREGDPPITLRWVGQEIINDVQLLLDLARAKDAREVRGVFKGWRLSVWNAVYADAQGEFGYQMVGSVPGRPVLARGVRPAYEDGHEWDGYVTSEEMPGLQNPEQGWVGSANNPPAPLEYPQPLYGTYADAYRFNRIAEVLSSAKGYTLEETAGLQSDALSLRACDLAGSVSEKLSDSSDEDLRNAAETLRGWNGRFDRDQRGAPIWAGLWRRFVRRVGRAVLPAHAAELNQNNAGRLARHLLLGETPEFAVIDVQGELEAAARDALTYLRKALGVDPTTVTWGEVHYVTFRHPLATTSASERLLNRGPFPLSGGEGVLNNRGWTETKRGFEMISGPSYRFAADLADPARALGTQLTGQSGQPGSPHYDDQITDFIEGRHHPLLLDDGAINQSAFSIVELRAIAGRTQV